MEDYEPHHLADMFPKMTAEEYAALLKDVDANGVRDKVVIFEEKILDGRHRYKAGKETGHMIRFEDFEGDYKAAQAFVLSKNLHRRHLNPGQRAAIVAEIVVAKPVGRPKANSPGPDNSMSVAEAADIYEASRTTSYEAIKLKKDSPELFAQVKAGKVTINAAIAQHRAAAARATKAAPAPAPASTSTATPAAPPPAPSAPADPFDDSPEAAAALKYIDSVLPYFFTKPLLEKLGSFLHYYIVPTFRNAVVKYERRMFNAPEETKRLQTAIEQAEKTQHDLDTRSLTSIIDRARWDKLRRMSHQGRPMTAPEDVEAFRREVWDLMQELEPRFAAEKRQAERNAAASERMKAHHAAKRAANGDGEK